MNLAEKHPSTTPMLEKGRPAVVLAPMDGITDAPVRELLTEIGSFTFSVSEFLRVSHEVPPLRVVRRIFPEIDRGCVTPSGSPVQLQILGGDPGRMAELASLAVAGGATAIDINFGCPAKTVNRHDGGASLLRYPHRIRDVVAAVRAALPAAVPVSAKLRLGWECTRDVLVNAAMAEEGGASWITIHGRTKTQGYSPPAYWGPIGEVRARASIPVVANGEIWTERDLMECREQTGCEHFMLGRGTIADPYLSWRISCSLGICEACDPPHLRTRAEWAVLLRRFERAAAAAGMSEAYLIARMKRWLSLASFRNVIDWFDAVKRAGGREEFFGALENPAPVDCRCGNGILDAHSAGEGGTASEESHV